MSEDNLLLRLDLLQCKFAGLDPPRFNNTKRICQSKKNKFKFLDVSRDDARVLIKEYQRKQFELKYQEFHGKLTKLAQKLISRELKNTAKFKKLKVDQRLINQYVDAKMTKTISKIYTSFIKDESDLVPESFYKLLADVKANNPHNGQSKEMESLIAKVWGKTSARESVEKMRTQFRLILGAVREAKGDKPGKENKEKEASKADGEPKAAKKPVKAKEPTDEELSKYNDMIASSEEEDDKVEEEEEEEEDKAKEENDKVEEEDDFFTTEPEQKSSASLPKLPALATGYLSGSDGEVADDADPVVEKVTKERKNRRGQRARRKIWEQKYGKKAHHIVKETKEWAKKREQLKSEYDERVQKRAEKEQKRLERQKEQQAIRDKPLHPSWVAKRKQEEELNAKFSGKKVKF